MPDSVTDRGAVYLAGMYRSVGRGQPTGCLLPDVDTSTGLSRLFPANRSFITTRASRPLTVRSYPGDNILVSMGLVSA